MRAGNHVSLQRGFTYITVLLLVAVMSLGLAVAGPKWSDSQRREREAELLRIGPLYAQAIAAYYEASPGSLKQYPPTLDALLMDGRFVGTRRHLRKLYADPLTPGQPMQVVTDAQGHVKGVFSASTLQPLRQTPLHFDHMAETPPAAQYRQWIFLAEPRT